MFWTYFSQMHAPLRHNSLCSWLHAQDPVERRAICIIDFKSKAGNVGQSVKKVPGYSSVAASQTSTHGGKTNLATLFVFCDIVSSHDSTRSLATIRSMNELSSAAGIVTANTEIRRLRLLLLMRYMRYMT
jgi:hypothetical protein